MKEVTYGLVNDTAVLNLRNTTWVRKRGASRLSPREMKVRSKEVGKGMAWG